MNIKIMSAQSHDQSALHATGYEPIITINTTVDTIVGHVVCIQVTKTFTLK